MRGIAADIVDARHSSFECSRPPPKFLAKFCTRRAFIPLYNFHYIIQNNNLYNVIWFLLRGKFGRTNSRKRQHSIQSTFLPHCSTAKDSSHCPFFRRTMFVMAEFSQRNRLPAHFSQIKNSQWKIAAAVVKGRRRDFDPLWQLCNFTLSAFRNGGLFRCHVARRIQQYDNRFIFPSNSVASVFLSLSVLFFFFFFFV